MTSWPCSASSAAATDESTPPDIATTIRTVSAGCRGLRPAGQPAKLLHEPRQHREHPVDLLAGRKQPEAEPQRVLRPVGRKTHGAQHVRRLERAGGAGGTR